jgi:hypothetical protein
VSRTDFRRLPEVPRDSAQAREPPGSAQGVEPERTIDWRCLSIPDGVPFTMLQHPIDPDRRDYEGKAAAFSRPDGTLVWVKKPDESFAY